MKKRRGGISIVLVVSVLSTSPAQAKTVVVALIPTLAIEKLSLASSLFEMKCHRNGSQYDATFSPCTHSSIFFTLIVILM